MRAGYLSIQSHICTVYLCTCVCVRACVFITLCMQAAALPTGIRSFRHIFTSSAFKGINIAPAAVAGLNELLGGAEGGWMSNAIFPLLLPSLCLPLLFALMRYDMIRSWEGYSQLLTETGKATVSAWVLCLEEYRILSLHRRLRL